MNKRRRRGERSYSISSVEEKAFATNKQLMGVVEGQWNAIRKRHVRRLLEEQDRVLRSYYTQRDGLSLGKAGSQVRRGLGTAAGWKDRPD